MFVVQMHDFIAKQTSTEGFYLHLFVTILRAKLRLYRRNLLRVKLLCLPMRVTSYGDA